MTRINFAASVGRHATPEEIARSVLYLATDDSSFVTGMTLSVDGE
jgi:NAD(P)-dependent dehydrogenase (short-subunit alcohol dehydrogenase family)